MFTIMKSDTKHTLHVYGKGHEVTFETLNLQDAITAKWELEQTGVSVTIDRPIETKGAQCTITPELDYLQKEVYER